MLPSACSFIVLVVLSYTACFDLHGHLPRTKEKRQKTSKADSFRNMKVKYPTHVKMAM
jgi:hypothetical protein